jgi:hypothetical protein
MTAEEGTPERGLELLRAATKQMEIAVQILGEIREE